MKISRVTFQLYLLVIIICYLSTISYAQTIKKVIINPNIGLFYAYQGDILIRIGKMSAGRKWCPDIKKPCKTPAGVFSVLAKKGYNYRSPLYPIGCKGKECAPMYYAIKFIYTGEAIHGANNIPNYNASHGCIRVSIKDARWLNKEFIDRNTKIIVIKY